MATETKPALIELLLPVSGNEFFNRSKRSDKDQVFWRRRGPSKNSSSVQPDEMWGLLLYPDGSRTWELITGEISKYGQGSTWDGKIWMVLDESKQSGQVEVATSSSPHWAELWKSAEKNLNEEEILNCCAKVGQSHNSSTDKRLTSLVRSGRAVVCSSFEGEWLSIVVRGDAAEEPTPSESEQFVATRQKCRDVLDTSPWRPMRGPHPKFLFTFEEYVEVLAERIFTGAESHPLSGLIVIMGETGCGKTEISYGLMHQYLMLRIGEKQNGKKEEKPDFCHVVTLEDPIEKRLYHPQESNYPGEKRFDSTSGIDYTARNKTFDGGLTAGLNDALRQKPSIVSVGEIRNSNDWPKVIEFAGTGHLVVATAHASSLSEALGKILKACRATTPAQRGDVGRKILALIHSVSIEVKPSTETEPTETEPTETEPTETKTSRTQSKQVNLLTLWQRDHGGANSLVSEGLASIVPFVEDEKGTWGSSGISRQMMESRKKKDAFDTQAAPFEANLAVEARRHDLKGI